MRPPQIPTPVTKPREQGAWCWHQERKTTENGRGRNYDKGGGSSPRKKGNLPSTQYSECHQFAFGENTETELSLSHVPRNRSQMTVGSQLLYKCNLRGATRFYDLSPRACPPELVPTGQSRVAAQPFDCVTIKVRTENKDTNKGQGRRTGRHSVAFLVTPRALRILYPKENSDRGKKGARDWETQNHAQRVVGKAKDSNNRSLG